MLRPSSESVNVLEDGKECVRLAEQQSPIFQLAVIRKYVRQFSLDFILRLANGSDMKNKRTSFNSSTAVIAD